MGGGGGGVGGGGVERGERRKREKRRQDDITQSSATSISTVWSPRDNQFHCATHTLPSLPNAVLKPVIKNGRRAPPSVLTNTSKTESLALGLNENRLTSGGVPVPCIYTHAR